jgi:hypothetical protein
MGTVLPQFFTLVTTVCLGAVFVALWLSLRALFQSAARSGESSLALSSDRQALLNEKHALLQGLRDLEQERDVGKVSQDDFDAMNARLRSRARVVLKDLDAQVAPFRQQAESLVKQVASKVEPSVVKPEASVAPNAVVPSEAPSEAPPEAPEVAVPDPLQCAKCETKNEADAVFCTKCGHRVADASGVAS